MAIYGTFKSSRFLSEAQKFSIQVNMKQISNVIQTHLVKNIHRQKIFVGKKIVSTFRWQIFYQIMYEMVDRLSQTLLI